MTLLVLFLATLGAGVGSVWVASVFMRVGGGGEGGQTQQGLLSLAAGALLATAFMHLLPEAFNSEADAHDLFMTLLAGIIFFFLLTKAELWHHGHEHGGAATPHHHGHHHAHHHAHEDGCAQTGQLQPSRAGGTGWSLLTGDSVHCFGDGVLIASAFLADIRLGLVAAVSVLAHEVPHHMGDLVVLRQGNHRKAAVFKVSLAGAVTALGGVAGYFLLERLESWLPYCLVLACSSFIYVALSDLVPQLQQRLSARQTVVQVIWLLAGVAVVTVVSTLAHGGHAH